MISPCWFLYRSFQSVFFLILIVLLSLAKTATYTNANKCLSSSVTDLHLTLKHLIHFELIFKGCGIKVSFHSTCRYSFFFLTQYQGNNILSILLYKTLVKGQLVILCWFLSYLFSFIGLMPPGCPYRFDY